MEYKANILSKILFTALSLFLIILPFWVFVDDDIFTKEFGFILLYFILSPILIFLGIDELYQSFRRIIIDNNIAKIKILGIIIKEIEIKTIEYNNKHYGIRKITHIVGSVKSIVINKKYFSCVTKLDDNYEKLKI